MLPLAMLTTVVCFFSGFMFLADPQSDRHNGLWAFVFMLAAMSLAPTMGLWAAMDFVNTRQILTVEPVWSSHVLANGLTAVMEGILGVGWLAGLVVKFKNIRAGRVGQWPRYNRAQRAVGAATVVYGIGYSTWLNLV